MGHALLGRYPSSLSYRLGNWYGMTPLKNRVYSVKDVMSFSILL